MAEERVRPLLSVEGVAVELTPPRHAGGDGCTVELHSSQLDLVTAVDRITFPFSAIRSIDLHQPIFGANYIVGEYTHQGQSCSFTLTFKKGGATDFTRLFFRVAGGRMEQSQPRTGNTLSLQSLVSIAGCGGSGSPEVGPGEGPATQSSTEDKKNR